MTTSRPRTTRDLIQFWEEQARQSAQLAQRQRADATRPNAWQMDSYYVDSQNRRKFPFVSYLFRVDLGWTQGDGAYVADFAECSGLGAEVTLDEFQEGGRNDIVRRLPSRVKYSNLTLQRGYVRNSELYRWCMATLTPPVKRRNVQISLMEYRSGTALGKVFTWTLQNAFPVKWTGPSLKVDASGNQAVAMERLELAYEGMTGTDQDA
jgi:phage tail-like protein